MNRFLPPGVALLATSLLLLSVPVGSAHADVPECRGRPATILATTGTTTGTDGDDVIVVSGEGANVQAGDGDDTICVVGSAHVLDAGAGNDVVDATAAASSAHVFAYLGDGDNVYLGGVGRDEVSTGSDHDTVRTGDNRDRVEVDSASADVSTGNGRDVVDVLVGDVHGGVLALGRGRDKISILARAGTLVADLAQHTVDVDGAQLSLVGAEDLRAAATTVRLHGDATSNVLGASACTVHLEGGAGDDTLQVLRPHDVDGKPDGCRSDSDGVYGDAGDDTLVAQRGIGVLAGGPGFDTARVRHADFACRVERNHGCHR